MEAIGKIRFRSEIIEMRDVDFKTGRRDTQVRI